MIDGRNEVQMHSNPTDLKIAMDASSFEYASMWCQFLQFHVQTCSITLQDHESSTRNGLDVKNLEEILRENFCDFGSRSEKWLFIP